MKFIINSQELNKCLKQVAPAISGNRIYPLLENVKLTILGNRCEIMASNNNNLTIISYCDCDSKEDGSVCLPFAQVNNISALLNAPMSFDCGKEIVIQIDGKKYRLGKSEDEKLYPAKPTFSEEFKIAVDSDFLNNVVMARNFTMKGSNEFDSKSYVWLHVEEDGVNVLATDNRQLFRYKYMVNSPEEKKVIFDDIVAQSVKGMSSADISLSKTHIQFSSLNFIVIGTLGSQALPNYSPFYPKYKINFTIDKQELLTAINSILAYESANDKFDIFFIDGGIRVYFEDAELNRNFDEEIKCDHSVEFEKIRVNIKLLKNSLSVIKDDYLKFSFENHNRPIHLDSEDSRAKLVLMPIALD